MERQGGAAARVHGCDEAAERGGWRVRVERTVSAASSVGCEEARVTAGVVRVRGTAHGTARVACARARPQPDASEMDGWHGRFASWRGRWTSHAVRLGGNARPWIDGRCAWLAWPSRVTQLARFRCGGRVGGRLRVCETYRSGTVGAQLHRHRAEGGGHGRGHRRGDVVVEVCFLLSRVFRRAGGALRA